ALLLEPADVLVNEVYFERVRAGASGHGVFDLEVDRLAGRDGARQQRLAVELADERARFVEDSDGRHNYACAHGLAREPERVARVLYGDGERERLAGRDLFGRG